MDLATVRAKVAMMRVAIRQACEASGDPNVMAHAGLDPECQVHIVDCLEMLWHLGGRLNRAKRMPELKQRRARKKLRPGELEQKTIDAGCLLHDDADSPGAGGGTASGGSRRKRKRELWDKLRGQSTTDIRND